MQDKRKQLIEVVAYNTDWVKQFEDEALKLKSVFGDNVVEIHHIGSTAVPGLAAKPTIDIILVVKNIDKIDLENKAMASLGYEAWGEYGINGRRFFVKGNTKRTHHVHAFQTDSPEIMRHVYLRDYLRAHPQEAKAYAELKLKLAQQFVNNRQAYVTNKADFVKRLEQKAIVWANTV